MRMTFPGKRRKKMIDLFRFLEEEGVNRDILAGVRAFRDTFPADPAFEDRIPKPSACYFKRALCRAVLHPVRREPAAGRAEGDREKSLV